MKNLTRHMILASIVAAAIAWPSVASAAPALPPAGPARSSITATDAPTNRALELQRSIDEVQAEQISIDNRIAVTSQLLVEQTNYLDQATSQLKLAQGLYDERVVEMYKTGDGSLFSILLDSTSFNDFVRRLTLYASILEADRVALEELSIVAAQAQFQAGQLETLRSQDNTLRGLKDQRARSLAAAVSAQQALLASLPLTSRTLLGTLQSETAARRAVWKAASVPAGTVPRRVPGHVSPYGATYLVSQFHYRNFRSAGKKHTAVASWYGTAYDGRTTASGEIFNAADFTAASPDLPFGTWLALSQTDPTTKKTRRIVVVVNDRGPYVSGRSLDLSRAAAEALGIAQLGAATVTVEVVRPVTN